MDEQRKGQEETHTQTSPPSSAYPVSSMRASLGVIIGNAHYRRKVCARLFSFMSRKKSDIVIKDESRRWDETRNAEDNNILSLLPESVRYLPFKKKTRV